MLRLHVLGGLAVTGANEGATGAAATRRKPLALLAVLASAGSWGTTRDKLLAVLWPEATDEQARTVLRQTLYALRRDLDEQDLVVGAPELRLNPAVIGCDLIDFEAALERGDLHAAATLYRGPFLDGFHLAGASEFERWADAERRRIDDSARSALETLATEAERREDFAAAVAWWRRVSALDPFNSRVARGLMRSLVASGDPGGAIRHARLHQELVRQELSSDPDSAFLSFAATLHANRGGGVGGGASRLAERAAPAPAPAAQPTVDVVPNTTGESADARGGAPDRSWRTAPSRLTMVGLAGAATVATMAFAVTRTTLSDDPAAPPASVAISNTIVVLPFDVHGGTESRYLSEGMVDLLGRNLHGAGDLRSIEPSIVLGSNDTRPPNAVDPRAGAALARRLGAGLFVLGDVTEVGGRLRIGASVFSTALPAGAIASAGASGPVNDVFSLVDSLTRELISGLHRTSGARLEGLAATTTSSLPALKAFLEGQSHFRRTRFAEAVEDFQRAAALDTTFALAYYRLSTAADYMSRSDLARQAADRAARLAHRLTPRDSTLLEARRLWWRAAFDDAERLCRQVLAGHPEDVETWNLLGEILFHGNPLRGRPIGEARRSFEQVLAARPDDREAIDHLSRIAGAERRLGESFRLTRAAYRLGVRGAFLEEPRDSLTAWRIATLRDPATRKRWIPMYRVNDFGATHASAARLATVWGNLDAAVEIERLLTQPGLQATTRAFAHITLAHMALARGRWRDARAELAAAAPLDRLHALEYDALMSATLYLTPTSDELAARRRELESLSAPAMLSSQVEHLQPFDTAHAVLRRYLVGLLSARMGDTLVVNDAAAGLEADDSESPDTRQLARALSHSLRALVAWQSGRAKDALAELESARLETSLTMLVAPFGSRSWERYLRAEALHSLGREEEAIGWYESMGQTWTYDLIYFAPALARVGEILERRGRPVQAIEKYARVIELWPDPDRELRPLVDVVRARLTVLCRDPRDVAACEQFR